MNNNDKYTWFVKTPIDIVEIILDNVEYSGNSILESTILDPAAWDGNFLVPILKRIIQEAKKQSKDNEEIKQILNNQIHAWELSEELLIMAKWRLNSILDAEWIGWIGWNQFKVVNSIIEWNKKEHKWEFDYIVWNPPYIRIQNLEEEDRQIIRDNSTLCKKGSMDIYIPFFELGFNMLAKNGKLGYITPNTLLKTQSAKGLRNFLLNDTNILKLIDFKEHQVFDATTYSLITIVENSDIDNSKIELFYSNDKLEIEKVWNINLKEQWESTWNLLPEDINDRVKEIENRWVQLWNYARISTWLATLADDIYINKIIDYNKDNKIQTIITKDLKEYKIETAILKKIIKASKLKKVTDDQKLFILFPYIKNEEWKHKIIDEDTLKTNYPLAYQYFIDNKKRLLARDKWKLNPVAWYAFWRSQWLDNSFWKKILTSTMNKKPNFLYLDDEDTTYIAWYSVVLPDWTNKDLILKQLNSEDMEFYINNTSRDYRGWYKSYAKSFLKTFWIKSK